MTDWPENDELMRFEDLSKPVEDLVRQAYSLRRKPAIKEGLGWKGPSLPESMAATCLDFAETISAEGLRYNDEEQGRDPLITIIGIAVQLGIEQGRRISSGEVKDLRERLDIMRKVLKEVNA